jgi:hypothetical protein
MRLAGLVSKHTFANPHKLKEAEDKLENVVKVEKLAQKLSKMTDNNQHTEAAVELAKFVGDKKWITITQSIEAIHNAEGSIPLAVVKYRTEIIDRLLNAVGHKMGTPTKTKLGSAL